MVLSILGIVATLVGILAWWLKRKQAPTKDEQILDLRNEYSETLENVKRLRDLGLNAEAEDLLARLRSRAVIGSGLRNVTSNPGVSDVSAGQRVGPDPAKGQ